MVAAACVASNSCAERWGFATHVDNISSPLWQCSPPQGVGIVLGVAACDISRRVAPHSNHVIEALTPPRLRVQKAGQRVS